MAIKIDGSNDITLPTTQGDVVGTIATQSISNKIINFSNNTIVTSLAQLNSAVIDADLVDLASFNSHKSDSNNPHAVTAAQVGLGNVNNTADLDKPISTATQTALSAKADASVVGDIAAALTAINGA